jgi:hypothetical protein
MTDRATYVYCVTRSAAKPSTARVPSGLPGATRPVPVPLQRSLWLIASDVPLHTYGPAALEPALRDIQWVADIAVSHEAVVEHFTRLRAAAVVPMKLFTMFSSVERAVAEMKTKVGDIRKVLDRIAGCEEWGVRIVRVAAPSVAARRRVPASGAAFLVAKKQTRDAAVERARRAAEAADEVFDQLRALTRSAWRRDGVPEGATTPPLLDAAFLVPVKQRARFRAAARRLAARCAGEAAEMTLTGPWPAYSFSQPEERS